MRTLTAFTISIVLLLSLTSAHLIPPRLLHQGPLLPSRPPSTMSSTTAADSPLLSDFLGTQRSLTTFSSLLRQHDSAASLVSSSSSRATLLAPLNSAVEALPRRPWERPNDYDALGTAAYEGNEGKERADKNTRLFVDAHVLPQSPWQSGDRVKTLTGREVWWEEKDGKRLIMPNKIEVERVANKAGNGELVGLTMWF